MMDINEAKKLVTYCGGFCGGCAIYKGRIITKIAEDLKELVDSSNYVDWLPKYGGVDFNFTEFQKGLAYFTKENSGCYCQAPCKEGGGAPCKIRPCAKEKGVEICYQCKDFLCEHFAWLKHEHPRMLEDCERFKKLGFDGWLKFHIERAEKGYANGTLKYYTPAKKE